VDQTCAACGRSYGLRDGVWRFLTEERARADEPFVRQYRTVREHEGYRASSPEYYRELPEVADSDPHAAEWRVRQESYEHLLQFVLGSSGMPMRVLDLGAGNGWLSHRLAALGHEVVAVDRIADAADGLGAACHYPVRFPVVQASFDALPFVPEQFDAAVFNGSLHYAADVGAALVSARRMLIAGGMLAVMDSPMFHGERSGRAMVDDMRRRFASAYGIQDAVRAGDGYLTFASLAHAATSLGARSQFIPSRGPVGWRVRREIARLRLRRAPAAFGLWIAR
jgi:SAM-dependent methyltransferase